MPRRHGPTAARGRRAPRAPDEPRGLSCLPAAQVPRSVPPPPRRRAGSSGRRAPCPPREPRARATRPRKGPRARSSCRRVRPSPTAALQAVWAMAGGEGGMRVAFAKTGALGAKGMATRRQAERWGRRPSSRGFSEEALSTIKKEISVPSRRTAGTGMGAGRQIWGDFKMIQERQNLPQLCSHKGSPKGTRSSAEGRRRPPESASRGCKRVLATDYRVEQITWGPARSLSLVPKYITCLLVPPPTLPSSATRATPLFPRLPGAPRRGGGGGGRFMEF